jgi:L-seryl-tRNA(Ser) seleniumtransferase
MIDLYKLPSVEHLLQTQQAAELVAAFGRPLTLSAIRGTLDGIRRQASLEKNGPLPENAALLNEARRMLMEWTEPSLKPVINASGVILHTNLGRAPLSEAALAAMQAVGRNYSSLEFDLASGKRGSRSRHVELQLQRLTGAEAALVVSNNAAALLLILSALAAHRRVIIARSQLVEIGGGFRIPDVMKQSAARLVEVGTTNKVRASDYQQALQEGAGLVMHVHRSNFKLVGFTEEPGLRELSELAHLAGVPSVDDLGSGALLNSERFGLGHEPTVQESLEAGMDVVCFSGDKLLGGPQAGIIVGRSALLARIARHPLARAVRADKFCLAALSATLLHYLKDEAEQAIPVWRMISARPDQIKRRTRTWVRELGQGEVAAGVSTVGGGSLPEETLPTFLLALAPPSADTLLTSMRRQQPPIIARAENGRVLLDPRTVLPEQDKLLLESLVQCLKEIQKPTRKVRG